MTLVIERSPEMAGRRGRAMFQSWRWRTASTICRPSVRRSFAQSCARHALFVCRQALGKLRRVALQLADKVFGGIAKATYVVMGFLPSAARLRPRHE